ncbi:MAG: metallophosphoesterase, partial [Pirellulales bacterium]
MPQSDKYALILPRRKFLCAAGAGLLLPMVPRTVGAKGTNDDGSLTFLVTADPQINIPKWGTAGTEETIDAMNRIAGTPFPFGGEVGEPVGVIVAGDLVDTLDNPENWKRYKSFYHPQGKSRLRFPVYEGIGNHDLTSKQKFGEFNPLQREFIKRNKQRPGELIFCDNTYHYAWQWAGVHFVQLNLFPGNDHRPVYDRRAPWNDPKRSLDFLKHYLDKHIDDTDTPIVLTWHYGLRGWGLEKWWTTEDLDRLAKAIEGYHIVLILHGHEHSFARYRWQGYDVIMSPSPQRDRDPKQPEVPSKPKGFLVF